MSLAFVCGLLDPCVWWSVTGTSLCLYSKSYIAKSKYRYSFAHIHGHKQTIVRLNMPQHVAPPVSLCSPIRAFLFLFAFFLVFTTATLEDSPKCVSTTQRSIQVKISFSDGGNRFFYAFVYKGVFSVLFTQVTFIC